MTLVHTEFVSIRFYRLMEAKKKEHLYELERRNQIARIKEAEKRREAELIERRRAEQNEGFKIREGCG